MRFPAYTAPWFLGQGLLMTVYVALRFHRRWRQTIGIAEPPYQERIWTGSDGIPLYGWFAIPDQAKGTLIATYGITGSLQDQGLLRAWGAKAYARGYAVVLFDWRAHGRSAELSPTLTSDGIHEGPDFVWIARQARQLGCPDPIWLGGYSLGGQLALWGIQTAQQWGDPVAGGVVLCPNLDGERSLCYLMSHPTGRYLEKSITRNLQTLVRALQVYHPGQWDPAAIARATSIWAFDRELVIPRLGFDCVEDYYRASSPLPWLPHLNKPTLVIYAQDDPIFDPVLIPELESIANQNPQLDLLLTPHGGHAGYVSSQPGQALCQDPDPWWAWNRALAWMDAQTELFCKPAPG